jgi:hypothetical protein
MFKVILNINPSDQKLLLYQPRVCLREVTFDEENDNEDDNQDIGRLVVYAYWVHRIHGEDKEEIDDITVENQPLLWNDGILPHPIVLFTPQGPLARIAKFNIMNYEHEPEIEYHVIDFDNLLLN